MGHWNKIDWYCPECAEYWMTTENCSPYCELLCECECQGAKPHMAICKCHVCGESLEHGKELCCHVADRSQAM